MKAKRLGFLYPPIKAALRIVDDLSWKLAEIVGVSRDWQVSFSAQGKAGETQSVAVDPQMRFRGRKLVITDILPEAARPPCEAKRPMASQLMQLRIGRRNQFPTTASGILSVVFASDAYGNGIRFDTCRLGEEMWFEIHFLRDCAVHGTLFGQGIML